MVIKSLKSVFLLLFMVSCSADEKQTEGEYYAGDFHQHCLASSDGSVDCRTMLLENAAEKLKSKKLDLIASSNFTEFDPYVPLFNTIHHLQHSKVLLVAQLNARPQAGGPRRPEGRAPVMSVRVYVPVTSSVRRSTTMLRRL